MRWAFDGFEVDEKAYTVTGPAGVVHVEPQVFDVLRYLLVHRDRVVPKEELLDAVWRSRFVSESALTSRVKAARRAVGDDGGAQRVIKTIHGRGYQFVAAVRADPGRARHYLPHLRNRLIGRDDDVTRVVQLLRNSPLVTVTGPGGIGKTSLALAVAHQVRSEYADGVVFADLSPVPAHADIARAVANAAGIEGGAGESIGSVADHLANRPVLLVLDNCEHVLEHSTALVDRMLERGEAAHVLATSREPLGVPGEHVWPLGPLTDDGPVLFVERARAAEPRIDWSPSDLAVIELCRRLDGVPLALELAAGQLRRFDIDELYRRLDDRLTLLASAATGDRQRHATLETAIDWSYRLLDPTEQRLLRHLGVFPSSFDLEAVDASTPALAGSAPARISGSVPERSGSALVVFGQLVDKSLVVREPGSGRYRLLETVRVFARERLDDAGETAEAFDRHRRHVLHGVARRSRLDRWMSARLAAGFRNSLDDARQAFRLSVERDQGHDALEIALGASFLWRNTLGCLEGDSWLRDLLTLRLSPHDEVWLHVLRADVGLGRGNHRQMFAAASSVKRLGRGVDDPVAACLGAHYASLAFLSDTDRALVRLATALDLAQQSGDSRLVVLAEAYAAIARAARRRDQGQDFLERLDRLASEDGYDRFILNWAGWILALAQRDGVRARSWMNKQNEYLGRSGLIETWLSRFSSAMCDVLDGGDLHGTLNRTLALADWEGYQAHADCLLALAYAEIVADRLEAAAELVGAALQGRFNATANHAVYQVVLDPVLREGLEPDVLAAAIARGRGRKAADLLADHGIPGPRKTDWGRLR